MTEFQESKMYNDAVSDNGSAGEQAAVAAGEEPIAQCVAVVEGYDDAPDECTIFPLYVDEGAQTTTWISAAEGSFVPRSEMC
ncbi:DUF7511 domain-containing protein [Haladaptatus sp. ZSTT2]|uniref:DUF7511 domain-containing protein n=1 Tax=Haladaptatus sp. ZSTT2 TaxID=3120515 RepID=UPI00300F2D79